MEYTSKSSGKHYWRKFILLVLTWIIIAIGVGLLSAWMLGYSFNREQGAIEQGGILQIGTKPSSAKVTINGVSQIRTTNYKYVGPAGDYALELSRAGYRSWQKTVPILPGRITWSTYARLIPEKIEADPVVEVASTLVDAMPSGSGAYYALLHSEEGLPSMSIVRIDGEEVEETPKEIPTNIISEGDEGAAHSYEIVAWSGDERRILLQHDFGEDTEWIVIDRRNPEDSINASTLLGLNNIEDVMFANNDGRSLYGVVDGGLRVLSLDRGSISRPYASNVESYSMAASNYITYVTEPNEEGMQDVGYTKTSFDEPVVLRSIESVPGAEVLVTMDDYFDTWHVLIGQGREAVLYSTPRLPSSPKGSIALTHVEDLTLGSQVTDMRFSANGQLAIVEDGYSFAAYNLEIKQTNSTTLEGVTEHPRMTRHLDSHLLWTDNGEGVMRTYEFDGANQHNLVEAEIKFDATFSPSSKYLYSIRSAEEGFELTRVKFLD